MMNHPICSTKHPQIKNPITLIRQLSLNLGERKQFLKTYSTKQVTFD